VARTAYVSVGVTCGAGNDLRAEAGAGRELPESCRAIDVRWPALLRTSAAIRLIVIEIVNASMG
jgi:hypothetical protein